MSVDLISIFFIENPVSASTWVTHILQHCLSYILIADDESDALIFYSYSKCVSKTTEFKFSVYFIILVTFVTTGLDAAKKWFKW